MRGSVLHIQRSRLPGRFAIFTEELQHRHWVREGVEGKSRGFSLPCTALPFIHCWQKLGHMATMAAREAGKGSSMLGAALLLLL